MTQIDIYDFDKTIVPFDSGSLFTLYCMLCYPWCLLLLPVIAVAFILMLIGVIHFTAFKRVCFLYVRFIPKERAVRQFWDRHINQVHPWFKERARYSVVISASPDFLLNDIAERLSFDKLICTRHDEKTGIIIGENCRGEEKVRRLFEEFDKDSLEVVDVYSDSLKHDKPIFSLAGGKCYHIVKGEKTEFNFKDVYKD